jgi:hypothetical protein
MVEVGVKKGAKLVFNRVIKHFYGILFSRTTVIRTMVLVTFINDRRCVALRSNVLTGDIEGWREPWMRLVDEYSMERRRSRHLHPEASGGGAHGVSVSHEWKPLVHIRHGSGRFRSE